ncbi:histidine phosphatase family protein [Haematobacter massiliensis]|uniref:Phosphoglycerate mutase n=1 Tax=Haematobacter massiliensis TaxID=195105 RepID=A0A086XW37_9RHOB|nr:histidine phosphatase family protein [Haematobacter massiliensis]KFI26237.1 phosphoglycerate mutase [Haematobacter massiliensis]OWJ70101.1 histidine phosphatase family protein [Haematobacter massiliensis]OWJ86715.1 histidine phosphatase family protein [Haematobacter massiliensis]QBJ24655.1 histidine phosphatase family protein [Haematobacter massiliensis]
MTLRLILTRHAKSSWGDPTAADFDRKLNNRGQQAATDIGAWLAERGYLPQQVLCSTAMRTRQTWERMAQHLPEPKALHFVPELYHAEPAVILALLRQAEEPVVALIGHNPGIGEFAQRIVSDPPVHRDFGRYPTGATLIVDFEEDRWKDIAPRSGRTVDFVTPRDLER